MNPNSRSAIAVHERIRARDLVLFAMALALLVALPWMLVSAGSEPVEYRDQRSHTDVTVPAWIGLLAFIVPFLVWPGIKAWNLLAKPAAATLGPGGIRLYDDVRGYYARQGSKKVNLAWDEVHRIVLTPDSPNAFESLQLPGSGVPTVTTSGVLAWMTTWWLALSMAQGVPKADDGSSVHTPPCQVTM